MNRSPLLLLLAPVLVAHLGACDPGDTMTTGTITPAPSPSPTPSPSPQPAPTPAPGPAPTPNPVQPEVPAGQDEARSAKPRKVIAPAPDAGAAAAHATFALDLSRALGPQAGNRVTSPASISIALAMTAAGARGETATGMLQALRRPGNASRLNDDMNLLATELTKRGEGTQGATGGAFALRLANRVWAQRGYALEAPFLDTLAESFGAGVGLVDFRTATEPARLTINSWVRDQTGSHIRDLIPKELLTANTRLVLTNAVYLDAAWAQPFFPQQTANGSFVRQDASTVKVAFMRQKGQLSSAQGPGWVAASLPFQDQRLALVVVVPDPGTFAAFTAGLDAPKLGQIVDALAPRETELVLPRFRFETAFSLKETLGQMGMARAFDQQLADFTGINGANGERLFIGDVVHKAFIAVSERGTEAAAATAVEVGAGAAPPPPVPPLLVSANRPFLFLVRDQPTGAVLFMGQVMDPSLTSGD